MDKAFSFSKKATHSIAVKNSLILTSTLRQMITWYFASKCPERKARAWQQLQGIRNHIQYDWYRCDDRSQGPFGACHLHLLLARRKVWHLGIQHLLRVWSSSVQYRRWKGVCVSSVSPSFSVPPSFPPCLPHTHTHTHTHTPPWDMAVSRMS